MIMSFGRMAAAAALLASAVSAQALTDADQKVVERGFDALYRGDYAGSEKIFEEAIKERPGDPPLSMGYAVATWWRVENDFARPGSPEEERFRDAIKRAIDDAQNATAKRDDAEAYVCLGAAYGLRGRLEAAQKHWLKAYFAGRRSYRSEQRAIQLDPGLYDAYLGIGAFDYYSARLSRLVRLFAFTKAPDAAQGLSELQAATRGRFSGVAAKLLLVQIDWTFEKKPREAWSILEELHGRYPESPLIDSMRLIGLFHLREAAGLEREARRFLEKAESGAAFYRPIDKAAGHYFLGLGEQLSGRCGEAIAEEQAALELIPEGHRTRGLPRLFIGECLDILGRREEALASYRQALKEAPFWGVPRRARYLLNRPFRAGDNPLPGRNDELD
jgi:tetratricopeptide (TPR) repeat protein